MKNAYKEPENPALPPSIMSLEPGSVGVVIVDPQIDFLREDGVAWNVVGENVVELDVVRNLARLFEIAKGRSLPTFISPHYYFQTDYGWKFEGALEKVMHSIKMFDRRSAYLSDGLEGSGADFMPQYKDAILDGETVICSPHKVYGPSSNDLALQLRKRRISQVVLAGMSANLCIESHLRTLLEDGFEVAVVKDATGAAKIPEGDGYLAALTNFRMTANAVWSTNEAVERLGAL